MGVVVGWFSLSAVRSPQSVLIMTDWKLYSQSAKRGPGPRRASLAQGLGRASSFISGRAREKAHGKHSWICVETSLLARAENTIIFFKFPQYKEYYGTSRLG